MPDHTETRLKAADLAITKAGGATSMARKLRERFEELGLPLPRGSSLTPNHVQQWLTRGVPAYYALHVEKMTGVSRHLLAPEVFGESEDSFAA